MWICKDLSDCEYVKYELYLIEHGANPNYEGRHTNRNIMQIAVQMKNFDLIQQLFDLVLSCKYIF